MYQEFEMASLPKTRRPHTKSRRGCYECKRRKMKCGEQRPICAGCTKRGVACEYPRMEHSRSPFYPSTQGLLLKPTLRIDQGDLGYSAIAPKTTPNNYASSNPSSTSWSSASSTGEKRIGHFDMEDMNLWHHFTRHTAATISTPWQDELPTIALTCDYLIHGILAMGALHLAYLNADDPSLHEKYTYLATQHQDLSLGPFQQAMSEITPANANTCFAFSSLLMAYNFASDGSPEYLFPFSTGKPREGLANWIVCLRGCSSIYMIARAEVRAGPLGFIFTIGRSIQQSLENGAIPDPEDGKSLIQITDIVLDLPAVKVCTTNEEMDSYRDAIEKLTNMLAGVAGGLDSISRRIASSVWACKVSETYIQMLREQRPPALIILAHYCLLLKQCEDCWFMKHRAAGLFDAVRRCLGAEWHIYIEHPRKLFRA